MFSGYCWEAEKNELVYCLYVLSVWVVVYSVSMFDWLVIECLESILSFVLVVCR